MLYIWGVRHPASGCGGGWGVAMLSVWGMFWNSGEWLGSVDEAVLSNDGDDGKINVEMMMMMTMTKPRG